MYGGGDWEQICECFTFAGSKLYDDNGNLISESNRTYKADGVVRGEFEHVLTVAEMPSHRHRLFIGSYTAGTGTISLTNGQRGEVRDANWFIDVGSAGGDQPHNNMPPYQVGYKWKRVG